jgi:O-antigen/teichoic acid export membrane protein
MVIWLTGPSVIRFLLAWAVVDLIEALLYWIVARKLCPQAIRLRNLRDWRRARLDNPGIGRFFLITCGNAALDAVLKQGPLLAVGYLVSTSAAGLYRLAAQLSQGLGKLSTLLMRAAYAEINRARVAANTADFRKLVLHTSLLAGGAGAVVLLLAALFGRQLLELIGGAEFRPAYAILIPLTVAACFELASVAFEPVLHSTGRARLALVARLAGLGAMVAGIAFFIGSAEAEQVAFAVALGAAVIYVLMGLMALLALRKLDHLPHPAAG